MLFLEGLVNEQRLTETVLAPLQQLQYRSADRQFDPDVVAACLTASRITVIPSIQAATDGLLTGAAILLAHGWGRAVRVDLAGWGKRSVEEPPQELAIRGPHQGFTETLTDNLAMVRRILHAPNLRIQTLTLGRQSQTRIALAYLHQVAGPTLVRTVKSRLQRVETDVVIDAGHLVEWIRDHPWSPLPTVDSTERPDRAAAQLASRAARQIEAAMRAAIEAARKARSDPFGFGERMRERSPAAWAVWQKQGAAGGLPSLSVTVHAEVDIIDTGQLFGTIPVP